MRVRSRRCWPDSPLRRPPPSTLQDLVVLIHGCHATFRPTDSSAISYYNGHLGCYDAQADSPRIALVREKGYMHPSVAAALKNDAETPESTTAQRPARSAQPKLSARDRAVLAARTAADTRATDVLVLEMTDLVKWTDYLVVATAASRRQLRSVADAVEKALADVGDLKIGVEGYELGEWIVVDFADVVLHVFSPEKRGYYEIEHLWGDATRVPWQPPAAAE